MANPLTDQVVLVTGAGRGIGKATALALAAEGARVGLVARTTAQLDTVADTIRSAGGDALPITCDVADPDQVAAAVQQVHTHFGALNGLVNNAGIFLEAPITDMQLEDWEHSLRVNTTAPFLFCQAALRIMKDQGGGKIVNISSTSGVTGYLYQSAYCASKHALLGFSRCLALEAKPHHVHVYTLCPGGVGTEFIAGTYLAERLSGQTMLEPENVSDLVVYVLKQPDNVDIAEVVIRRCHVE